MKRFVFVCCMIAMVVLSGCKSHKKSEDSSYEKVFKGIDSIPEIKDFGNAAFQIVIPQNMSEQSIRTDSLVDTIAFLPLETTENNFISKIDDLIFFEDKIVVSDKKIGKRALLFTSGGKFVTQIGQLGRGPSEYIFLSDIAIDKKKKQLVIFDGAAKKLLYYDMNGRFVKNSPAYYYSDNMYIDNSNNFIYHQYEGGNNGLHGVENFEIIIADSSQRILRKTLPLKMGTPSIYNQYNYNVTSTNHLLFNPRNSSEIYELGDTPYVRLKYKIILGERDVYNNKYSSIEEFLDDLNKKRLYDFDGPAVEVGDWLYFRVSNAGHFFFNSKTGKLVGGTSYGFMTNSTQKDDEYLKKLKYINIDNTISCTDNYFVSVIWPSDYMVRSNRSEVISDTFRIASVDKPISFNDNPILVFYTLK